MAQVHRDEEPSAFDTILAQIGNAGRYQKRFNLTFNFLLVIVAAMPNMNLVFSLVTPNHWCHVPGRENTNYTLDEWKRLTIPMELGSNGKMRYSECKRFSTFTMDLYSSENATSARRDVAIVSCDRGWDYDRTWYDWTAPMRNDWVCDDAMVTANTLAMGRIGEVIGTLVFGQLADNYGRMPVFFVTVVMVVFGRVMSSLTSRWVYVFFFFSIVGSLPSTTVWQGPLVIAMEMSRAEDRALINMIQCVGWNMGLVLMPLLMWWLRDWVPFLLATTLPCAGFLFSKPWMIESPRWLASKGKIKRCVRELEKIARTNNTTLPANTEAILRNAYDLHAKEKNYSVLGLFSSPRLAKNTIVLIGCSTILLMIYMCLTIDVSNLGGNPFLNYLLQAFAELPGYIIGKYFSDRYGRRWTSFTSFIVTALGCIPILFLGNGSNNVLISALCIFLKFSISIAFCSVNLQCIEIYPTCIRQTGSLAGVIFGSGLGAVSPYIISVGGRINEKFPYAIYGITALVAAFSCVFLPETYGHHLPETLEDAANFGADQDFWGRTKRRNNQQRDGAEMPLNKPSQ